MEKLNILFGVFVIVGTTAAKPIEDEVYAMRKLLKNGSRLRPKGIDTPDQHVPSDFDLMRYLREAFLQRKMNQEIARSWFEEDPIIRGTSGATTRVTTPTTAPTSTTEEPTTTTIAARVTQSIVPKPPSGFWQNFWNLWKISNDPFG